MLSLEQALFVMSSGCDVKVLELLSIKKEFEIKMHSLSSNVCNATFLVNNFMNQASRQASPSFLRAPESGRSETL